MKGFSFFLIFLAKVSLAAQPLTIQLTSEPVSLDPGKAEDGVSMKILGNTSEGLMGYDGAGKLVHRLAKSHKISKSGRRYEFILKPEAKWSDGKAVEPAQFIAALDRIRDPKTASKFAHVFQSIESMKDEKGKLVIELKEEIPYFIQTLALVMASPIRQDVLDANQGKWPSTAPVTGPYRIAQHLPDRKYVLEKNPNYHMPTIGPEKVEFIIVGDDNTASNLFAQGKLDIISRIPSLEFESFKKMGVVRTDPLPATFYLSFNTTKPPFNDREWRRAFAGSIEKQEITSVLGTGEKPARSWIPIGIEGYLPFEKTAVFENSVSKIKSLAAQHAPVEAGFDTNPRNSLVMEKIQQDVSKNLGLKIQPINQDWKSHIRSVTTNAPSVYRFGMLALFMDPISHLEIFTTGNPNNYAKWSNPEYDKLVSHIARLKPGAKRLSKIRKAQAILVEREAAVVPIYHYVQVHGVKPRVGNFRANPLGVVRFDELRLKEGK